MSELGPTRPSPRIGGERGYLTIDNISGIYSVSKHPAVIAGRMTKEEALQEFLNSFEGDYGNRDGKVRRCSLTRTLSLPIGWGLA